MAVRIVHYPIHIRNSANRPAKAFSAVFLSDLHNMCYGEGNRILLQYIREADPAVIISAGDLVTAKAGRYGTEYAAALVRTLGQHYPVYLVSGNHEMRLQGNGYPGVYDAYISEAGIRKTEPENLPAEYAVPEPGAFLLDNASVYLEINGMNLRICGYAAPLDVYSRRHGQPISAAALSGALGSPSPDAFTVLAAHHPDGFPAYADWGADLSLSGHVHGGIVRLPVLGGVIGASLRPFPPYTWGCYELTDRSNASAVRKMIVSAGLGSHTIKLRINNPPELVVLDFCID